MTAPILSLLSERIQEGFALQVSSELTPPARISFKGDGGPPGLLMRALKPRLELVTADGASIATWSPAGPPASPSSWAYPVALGALLVLGVGGLVYLATRK